MRLAIRPDSLRWLLCAVNLVLLAFLAWCALFAFDFHKALGVALGYRGMDDRLSFRAPPDPGLFAIETPKDGAYDEDRPMRIARTLEPPPRAGTGASSRPDATPAAAESSLADTWALVCVLETSGEAQVYAVIEEKPAPKPAGTSVSPNRSEDGGRTYEPPSPRRWARSSAPRGRGTQLLVRLYDPVANPRPAVIGTEAYYFIGLREKPLGIICVEAPAGGRGDAGPDPAARKHILTRSAETSGDPLHLEGRLRA